MSLLRPAPEPPRPDHLLAMLQAAADGIWLTDVAGRILEANASACRLLGYDRPALLGLTAAELGASGSQEAEARREGSARSLARLRRADGTWLAVRLTTTFLAEARQFVGQFLPVPDRAADERAEDRRAIPGSGTSSTLLGTLLDTLPDLVWLKDPQGVYLECNARLAQCFGVNRADILGRTDLDFLDRALADLFRERDQTTLATGAPTRNVVEVTFKSDGHREFMETLKTPVFDPEGVPLGVLGIGRDITARKQAEEQLRISEERYHQAFYTSPLLASLSRLDDGLVIEVNDHYCRVLGFSREEILGRTSLELGIFQPEVRERMITALRPTHSIRNLELNARTKDGRAIPCLFFAEAFQVGGDRLLLVMALDIREHKAAEELRRKLDAEQHQMQKLDSLGSLASGVAHDMNNVLAAIQAVAETLRAQHDDDADLAGRLGLIDRACDRGRDLVKGLTHFARKDLREPEILDLNDMAAEEMQLLARTTLQKIKLVLDLEEALPPVMGERGTLASALMNLCVNAVDAMPGGGTLTLRTRSVPEGKVEVQVQDTGEGMGETVLARAMEPFFTTKPIGKGTGMGLSMAYATLQAHGGSLGLQSTPGQGTLVTLRLPAMNGSPAPSASPEQAPPKAGPLRILLVDDDALIQATVPGLLETLGHQVATATSGPEALVRLRDGEAFDLVILDLNMPDMNGAETLKDLRRTRPRLPVLMATGFLDAATGEQLDHDGWALSILKPFSKANLGQKLLEVEALKAR